MNNKLKIILITVLAVLSFNSRCLAQDKTSSLNNQLRIDHDKVLNNVKIDLNNESQIENLLIVITNNEGETVFLENIYRHKGPYKTNINFQNFKKGKYKVQVKKNSEETEKEIIIN